MRQMTLWELDQTTESFANPIWGQLDTVAKMETVIKLSLLMVKVVNPTQNQELSEEEGNHE